MMGTSQDQTVVRKTRRLVAVFLATVVRNDPPPAWWTFVTTRPRWVRASGGRSRSTTRAPPSTRAVTPTSTATVRHEMRLPLNAIRASPITGTSVKMPPTSPPRLGAPSTMTRSRRKPVMVSKASRRRGA